MMKDKPGGTANSFAKPAGASQEEKQMNVLMIDQWLPNQTYTLELARPLSARVSLTLMAPRYYHPEKEAFRCMNVLESKVRGKSALGLLSYFRGLLAMYRAALFGRYDVIHVQDFRQKRLERPAIRLARRLTGKKLVYTAHNILPHEKGGSKEADELKKWYRQCDAIIVHNEHSKKVLAAFEPSVADRIHVVPHGTYSGFSAFAKEQPHEKTVFLQFGMIRKYKGVGNLLKAASLLPEEYRKKIRIVIAGNQRKNLDDTDYQAMLDAYGLGDFVTFSPVRIPDDQVPDYFNGADCCLFPYTEIYGSGALLMAYSFCKPVIASGIPTFVEETDGGKTGLLYDPDQERGLTEAIQRFADLTEAEKDAMKENIRAICQTKYSWAASANTLAGIYKAVTGGAAR